MRHTADAWGIVDGYFDTQGTWRTTPEETRRAILEAMGVDTAAGPAREDAARVLRAGEAAALSTPGVVVLEDGTEVPVEGSLPPDLPAGYHTLRPGDRADPVPLIVAPARCFLPEDLRGWGWAVQLYAARSTESWGIGDLGDLRRLGRWASRDLGARLLLLNPLGAPTPAASPDPSPYRTSSRRFLNPLYLRVEEVPGAGEATLDLGRLAGEGRALNARRIIDHGAVWRLKITALERLWSRFGGDPSFDRYRQAEGPALREFATFCALAEHHASSWHRWPAEHRHPRDPAVARFAEARAERVRFHQWVQWLLQRQLGLAGQEIGLLHDLPVGVDPDGADAWAWQDVLALRVRVGAPPDTFNTEGQEWGLPPFIPHRLRAAGYGPLAETLRAVLRHAGGLRIDHVMGLFRLFWVPPGMSAKAGTYVRYRADELLAIVALESQRARALVVGEDLGTVEEGVREELAERRILSYRLLWFESEPPEGYPSLSVAAVTTHDLPTIAGVWTGQDLDDQRAAGLEPNEEGARYFQERLRTMTGVEAGTPTPEVIERTYGRLAGASSMIVLAALDDALGVAERPNIPGTTARERANWSLALPATLEEIERSALPRAVAGAFRERDARRPADGAPGDRPA